LIYDFEGRWWAFAWYLAWAVWMWFSQRYCHLRMSKRTFFTTYRMDAVFCWCFSFIILELGVIWVSWIQSYLQTYMKVHFDCSFLYCLALMPYIAYLLIVHWYIDLFEPLEVSEEEPRPYDEVADDLYYTYFNTNPVHVLRTRFLHDEGPPLSYYVTGKGYLVSKGREKHHIQQLRGVADGTKPQRLMIGGAEHHELTNLCARACWKPGYVKMDNVIDEHQFRLQDESRELLGPSPRSTLVTPRSELQLVPIVEESR